MTGGAAGAAFVVGSLSNDAAVLAHNLARSPMIASGAVPLIVERDAASAAVGINRLLDRTEAPVLAVAHHDVYFPMGWDALLRRRIAEVEAIDPDWAMIGAYGVGEDRQQYGPVWSSSVGAVHGRVRAMPMRAHSFDEILLVFRRASSLRCDEALPHFHFYGTDLPATARARRLGCWIAALPLVHNDRFKPAVGPDFAAAYRFVQKKWRAVLPLETPVARVSWHGLELGQVRRMMARGFDWRKGMAVPAETDPAAIAAACGWNDLAPVG